MKSQFHPDRINPYAPAVVVSPSSDDDEKMELLGIGLGPASPNQIPKNRVTTLAVAMHTIGGTAVAGGAFGAALLAMVFLSAGHYDLEILFLIGIGGGVGIILAGLYALVMTLVVLGLRRLFGPTSAIWTQQSVRNFAIISGGASGYCALAVTSGLQVQVLLWSMVPAACGAAGALLGARPCVRRCESVSHANRRSERSFG